MSTGATTAKELEDLRGQIIARQRAGEDLAKRVNDEGRHFSEEEMRDLKAINDEIKTMIASRNSLAEQESLVTQFSIRREQLEQPVLPPGFGFNAGGNAAGTGGAGQPESPGDRMALSQKSMGEQFIEDEGVQSYLKKIAPHGSISVNQAVRTPPVLFSSFLEENMPHTSHRGDVKRRAMDAQKALVTGLSATSAGALFQNFWYGLPDPAGVYQRPLTILDFIRRVPIQGDTVEYVRVGTPTNAAAPVAEATTVADGAKPESAYPLAVVTDTVRTIAHWIPITRRALADAPMIRVLVEDFLRYGLIEELEDQLISGAGTGENLTGIRNVSGIQTQAYSTSLLQTTRKAITLVQINGNADPTAFVMHPTDWEAFDLLVDGETRYYFGGPREMTPPRLWGRPVILNEGMTAAKTVVGDWRYFVLFDRQQTSLYVTDSHSDYFIRNILVMLAELRAASGCIRPKAFVDVSLSV